MTIRDWKQFTPFYFYTAVAILLVAVSRSNELSWSRISLFLLTGLLSWTVIEYVLHRFIFHFDAYTIFGRRFVYASHRSHHENPKDQDALFARLRISAPIAAGYLLVAWAVLGSWAVASYIFIGLIAGYFCYEWLHFQAHHRKPRLRIFRYLKKYHLLHHYRTPDSRFGVTSPVFDFAFGTFLAVKNAKGMVDRSV